MNRTIYLLAMVVLIITLTTSCSSTRKIIREPLKEQGTEYLFNNLKERELQYQHFSAKFNAAFTQNKKETQITGQIRIKRDSLIWVSISPLMGIEMARLQLTNDSIWFINRMDNTYFSGSIEYINKLINSTLDFDMVQSFLTGNDFSHYENASFKGGIDGSEYTLETSNRRKLKKFLKDNREVRIPLQRIWLNPETFKISRILIRELVPNGRKAEAHYNYESLDGQFVPNKVKFDVETEKDKTQLNINYSKIIIGDALQFPFRIPEKYTRVEKF